jgi:hypothetical protein
VVSNLPPSMKPGNQHPKVVKTGHSTPYSGFPRLFCTCGSPAWTRGTQWTCWPLAPLVRCKCFITEGRHLRLFRPGKLVFVVSLALSKPLLSPRRSGRHADDRREVLVIGFLQEGQVHVGYHRPICFLGFLLRFGRTWGKRGFFGTAL